MDPFLDLIRLLRPQAMLWSRIDAAGAWGLGFRKRDDLLFCWVEQGECLLTRSSIAPVHLQKDDFVVVRTSEPFAPVTSLDIEPLDSETVVATTGSVSFALGSGTSSPVILRGGRFVFDSANELLLSGLLPSLIHVAANDTSSERVRSLLKMNETETRQPGHGSEFIIMRLMELLFVEILRNKTFQVAPQQTGLIAGLADPVTARALSAMHKDVAHNWTVASLARICGVSRSTFATRFREIVGTGPIEYLAHWRIALAKDELRRGSRSIGEIALTIGFQSSSAFSTAFTRAVGSSPKRFAARPK
jgi:AraC-like DNA-binding protein